MTANKHSITWEEREKARGRLAAESGTICKDWGGKLPFAFIYPNSYYIGMSNLGLQGIYGWLNGQENVVCERLFRDKARTGGDAGTGSVPLSVESQRPLNDFAVLAFSLNYELDYFNIAPLLKDSGIPLYSAERDETQPLIIAGGPCIISNPLPVAPFFDCLCIGEAEAILPALLPILSRAISARREELLRELAAVPGIYVPRLASGKRVVRQWVKDLDQYPLHSVVVTPDTELNDLYLIEVERGCAHNCRFCLVKNAFTPMRFHSLEQLVEEAREGLRCRKRLGLVGPAVTDHPHIEELFERLLGMGAGFSISSLRITSLTPRLLEQMVRGGQRSIALAPEAGSECLRQTIRKGIDEDQVLEAVAQAAEKGMQQIKLYFMVGLPQENAEDISAAADLVLKSKRLVDRTRAKTRLSVNLSPFIPKAGTPFQWMPMAPLETLRERISALKAALSSQGIQIKHESPQWSEVQAVLSRGDSSLAAALAAMEGESLPAWRGAIEENRVDVDYFAHWQWDTDSPLPWAMIDSGTSTAKLAEELKTALGG